jgi:hypothetical protein
MFCRVTDHCYASSRAVRPQSRQGMLLVREIGFVILLIVGDAAWLPEIAQAEDAVRKSAVTNQNAARPSRSAGSMELGIHYSDPGAPARFHKRTTNLLTLADCLDDFDCRMSSQVLACGRSSKLSVKGPFRDVLLEVPVQGQAHVDGVLQIAPVANADRGALEMRIEGTARMIGSGSTHGVRLDSDATTRFVITKQLFLDHTGMTTQGAKCRATTTLVSKGVSAQQPRLIGRLTERIARRRVQESQQAAEAECSAHVAAAMQVAVDREVEALAQAMNHALAEHLAAATDEQRARWHKVRFHSEADCLCVSRGRDTLEHYAEYQVTAIKPPPALVLRLPREPLNVNRLLAGMHLLRPAEGGALATTAKNGQNALALHPSVSWQEKTVTVSLHYGATARLAQESSIGFSQ